MLGVFVFIIEMVFIYSEWVFVVGFVKGFVLGGIGVLFLVVYLGFILLWIKVSLSMFKMVLVLLFCWFFVVVIVFVVNS